MILVLSWHSPIPACCRPFLVLSARSLRSVAFWAWVLSCHGLEAAVVVGLATYTNSYLSDVCFFPVHAGRKCRFHE